MQGNCTCFKFLKTFSFWSKRLYSFWTVSWRTENLRRQTTLNDMIIEIILVLHCESMFSATENRTKQVAVKAYTAVKKQQISQVWKCSCITKWPTHLTWLVFNLFLHVNGNQMSELEYKWALISMFTSVVLSAHLLTMNASIKPKVQTRVLA